MSSRRGGRGLSGAGRGSFPKERNISGGSTPNAKVNQLSSGVANVSLESDNGGRWEVLSRKPMNRGGSSSSNPGVQNSNQKAWGQPDVVQKLGLGANRGFEEEKSNQKAWGQPNVVQKLGFGAHSGNSSSTVNADPRGPAGRGTSNVAPQPVNDGTDDDSDDWESDDEVFSDEFDSDESEKSHDTLKKSKWFKEFFKRMDELTLDQINEPLREWHCPACAGGPGAIDWYTLPPLMAHARTKGSKRVQLHRKLAQLLDEELRRRGTSVVPAGEAFGKWTGLTQEVKDRAIVWPPMVCIMNTQMEQDDNDKWIGMGNQELLAYFSAYNPSKARHSYGPQGHRGMSVLIFENTAVGYLDAERLHNHFHEQRTDRNAWNSQRRPKLLSAGGQRQLFGYMAEKPDLDVFNQHSQGKSKLKFELKSYVEEVVNQLRQMSEDNQSLTWLKKRVAKEQRHSKALEESLGFTAEKLRQTLDDNRIVKQRSKLHDEEIKEQMDAQEQFYKDQLEALLKARDAKEDKFEKIQQQEREKVQQSISNVSATQGARQRSEDVTKFIKIQDKEIDEFVVKRERLIKAHEEKEIELKKRHWEEALKLEKEFDDELNQLMAQYTPAASSDQGIRRNGQ